MTAYDYTIVLIPNRPPDAYELADAMDRAEHAASGVGQLHIVGITATPDSRIAVLFSIEARDSAQAGERAEDISSILTEALTDG